MNRSHSISILAIVASLLLLAVSTSTRARSQDSTKPLAASSAPNDYDLHCFVRLGEGGPILSMPERFWSSQSCPTATRPATQEFVSFDLQYPEMTPGAWPGAMARYLAHDIGPGQPMDRFQVRIVWVFFPLDLPRTVTDRWYGPEPLVWQQIEKAKERAKIPHAYPSPHIEPSEIKGLRKIKFGDPMQPSPAALERLKREGWWVPAKDEGALIEMPDADYELFAGCEQDFDCIGSVRMKSNHIQYRFLIPMRAKLRMAEVVDSVNNMIRSWVKN